jgi:LPXTG-site transpeptidase (sortase) family protein
VAVRVRIDRLSIDLPIIEGDGVDAPLAHVAHHPRTAWPDSGSNVFLYGHAQEGTLRSLWDVSVGDEVVITLVDGSSRSYAVTQVRPRTPWNATELLDPTPTERLTLQTSTGTEATSPRFVAIAERRP